MAQIFGYILPHPPLAVEQIGGGEEKKIQSTLDGYRQVAEHIAAVRPDTIILTSPHAIMYRDYFHMSDGTRDHGDFLRFGHPEAEMEVQYDTELRSAICRRAEAEHFPAGCEGGAVDSLSRDHGTMVPLSFVNRYYRDYRLIRIGLSGLPLREHVRFGRMIREVWEVECPEKKVVFLASGDLSHCQKEDGPYGYDPAGPAYDAKVVDVLRRGALPELARFSEAELSRAQECGHRSFTIMAGFFREKEVKAQIFSHEATFGVGYCTGIVSDQ